MIIGIRVEALNPETGKIRHTNSCYFTMAAKNAEGKLEEVPGLILENEQQIRRFAEGRLLKIMAMERKSILKSDLKHLTPSEMLEEILNEKCKIEVIKN
jgi:hypothetical protein